MREVEYQSPEFALEAAAVSTTKLTRPAAEAKPAMENMPTNGDASAMNLYQGVTAIKTVKAPNVKKE